MRAAAAVVAALLVSLPGSMLAQRSAPSVRRVAVFPLQHDMVPAQVGVILSDRVAGWLQEQEPGVSVLGPSGVLTQLAAPETQDAWNRFLFTFTMAGIVDPVELGRVCEDFGVDALLDLEIATWVQRDPTYAYGRRFLGALRMGLRVWWFGCSPPRLTWERWSEGVSVAPAPHDTTAGSVTSASASTAAGAAVEALLPLIPALPHEP